MKQSIEVIERDEDGHTIGTFKFWGSMTIDLNNGGGRISINAPGYHEPTPDENQYGPDSKINEKTRMPRECKYGQCKHPEHMDKDDELPYCKRHDITGHADGSPACDLHERLGSQS